MPTDELAAVRVETRESLGFADVTAAARMITEAVLGNAQSLWW